MQHKGRYLDRNHGTECPSNLIFFDTECYKNPHPTIPNKIVLTLRLWCATRVRIERGQVTRRKVASGTDSASFWKFVGEHSDHHRCTWLFAHNIGFDLTQLEFWELLDNGTFTIRPRGHRDDIDGGDQCTTKPGQLCLDSTPTYIVCRSGARSYKIVDTCNYWQRRLQDIARDMGTTKLPMPGQDDSNSDWQAYCEQDVRVLEWAICNLLSQWRSTDCGVFKMTAAALSMTNFQHVCPVRTDDGKHVDIVCKPDAREHELEREAYFGGRIQCYYVGSVSGVIRHVDVNSLYPAMMREHLYPRRFVGYSNKVTHDELLAKLDYYSVVASVRISTRWDTFPLRIDGQQYHARGWYWTALCGPELRRAIESGCVAKIGLVQWYARSALFREWVDYWHRRKVTASCSIPPKNGEREFCKVILNSLSGKWAQRGRHWKDVPDEYPVHRWGAYHCLDTATGVHTKARGVGGNKQVLTEGKEPRHSFPLISAYITAHAREFMRSVIDLLPIRSVYYMATDSLICDDEAYHKLIELGMVDEYELGKFKLVGTYKDVEIHGPNWYSHDGTTVATGRLGKYVQSKANNGKVELWEQTPQIIARKPDNAVMITVASVPVVTSHYRGVVQADGWWRPYHLTTDPDFGDAPPKGGYCLNDGADMEPGRILVSA